MAATLANSGLCPGSGVQCLPASVVVDVLAMMSTCTPKGCALHAEASKIPGWGGESGAMFAVVPGIGAFAVYSPSLNQSGFSSRGVQLCKEIIQSFRL